MRRRLAAYGGAGVLLVSIVGMSAGPNLASASGGPQTFPQVNCSAVVNGGTLSRKVDITLAATAPDTAPANSQVTITLPGGSAELLNTGSGLPISQYKNLSNTLSVTGGTIVAGSAAAAGDATYNGAVVAGTVAETATSVTFALPGPIGPVPAGTPLPPSTLVTPDRSFKVLAGAAGTQIKVSAAQLTTTAHIPALNTDAAVTCDIPANTMTTTDITGPVETTAPPTTGPPTSPPTTTPGQTTVPTTTPPTTTPPTTPPTTTPRLRHPER